MKSISDNSLFFRISLFVIGIAFLILFNYLFFSWIIGIEVSLNVSVLLIFLGASLFYMIKFFKYIYKIEDNKLIIKTPRKIYRIPFQDIKEVSKINKIPFFYKFGPNFNHNENILYLSGAANKGIMISLETHNIVISPIKYDKFYERLKNI